MTTEAISESILLREFTRELHNKNAAVFAGAGLSMASGYVDWKGLLRDIIVDLQLDPDQENDLVTLAQYHCNQARGKGRLTQTIFDKFREARAPMRNHEILARLPIQTYWTTNYDRLLETALVDAKKVPDVKYTLKQLAVTRLDRDVAVYKMHGDIEHPGDAVITKDDYEIYYTKMAPFVSALRGDLIEKTFLFLGFSFTDPNIDFILSRVRVQYGQDQRHHYCIQRKVEKLATDSDEDFKRKELKQDYFITDLKRFGIQTVLVAEFKDITTLLEKIAASYKRSSIFISGAAEEYGALSATDAQAFLHDLSKQIAAKKNRIITGFGLGVGGAVINGALAHLNDIGKTISDEDIVMRPFPQMATGGASLPNQWTSYRKAMVEHAGIAIFVYGNKLDAARKVISSNGMREEFDLCLQAGVRPLPVGATGYMAETLWKEVWADFAKFYPDADTTFRAEFEKLGNASTGPAGLISTLLKLIHHLQKN
ncbi:MAG: hypothetical protein FD165_934 [Gammaproteobacteria bacterium]|nr:MAG: hypothetical protein FD165_934 [Gammaproteobacteria bacterium]TND06357.1 MAG: hypothetical protein FD120_844 [Gammaproteobacteria bacterium]